MRRINPNLVTSLRFFIFGPLACLFLLTDHLAFALLAMGFAESTDGIDGYIARKTGQITDFGKIFDPMCDSIYHMTVWISFLAIGWVPTYIVLIFLVRDSIVSTIRICLASHGIVLAAKKSGKWKAGVQAGAQLLLVILHLSYDGRSLATVQQLVYSLAAVVTIFSLVDYSRSFWSVVKDKDIFSAHKN